MKNMDDLHLSGRADAVDINHASLYHKEGFAWLSFVKEIFVFL